MENGKWNMLSSLGKSYFDNSDMAKNRIKSYPIETVKDRKLLDDKPLEDMLLEFQRPNKKQNFELYLQKRYLVNWPKKIRQKKWQNAKQKSAHIINEKRDCKDILKKQGLFQNIKRLLQFGKNNGPDTDMENGQVVRCWHERGHKRAMEWGKRQWQDSQWVKDKKRAMEWGKRMHYVKRAMEWGKRQHGTTHQLENAYLGEPESALKKKKSTQSSKINNYKSYIHQQKQHLNAKRALEWGKRQQNFSYVPFNS